VSSVVKVFSLCFFVSFVVKRVWGFANCQWLIAKCWFSDLRLRNLRRMVSLDSCAFALIRG
jgi:hypothetical protein